MVKALLSRLKGLVSGGKVSAKKSTKKVSKGKKSKKKNVCEFC